MLKKLFTFMCGLVPFGAGAASVEPVPVTSPSLTTIVVSDTDVKVASGDMLQIYGAGLTDGVALDVSGDMRVFQTAAPQPAGGVFFVDTTSDTFELQIGGDMNVGGALTIGDADRTGVFNIQKYVNASGVVDVSIGALSNYGDFNVVGVDNFAVGAIDTTRGLSVSTNNNITTGAISQIIGDISLNAGNALSVGGIMNTVAGVNTVKLGGKTVSIVGDAQNTVGTMDITATNNLTVGGNVQNAGAGMTVQAGDVLVSGTVSNAAGKMTIGATSLTVNGGGAGESSFVNDADLTIDVSGLVQFTNGFNLVMDEGAYGNVFSLTAGTLVVGGGDVASLFLNDLNSYNITVNSSAFATNSDVSNGLNNSGAGMALSAVGLTVQNVTNYAGTMTLTALGAGDLVATSVTGAQGATTNLFAGNMVNVMGDVIAAGDMTLQGQAVQTENITNNGGDVTVSATGADTGLVTIIGDAHNKSGVLDISGRQIAILGDVINDSGEMSVNGSDLDNQAIGLGGVSVNGGVTTLNGLLGINIAQRQDGSDVLGAGTLAVTGGVLNFGAGTYNVTVNGSANNSGYVVDIADDIFVKAGTTISGDGDVYVAATGPQGFTLNANGKIRIGGDVIADATSETANTLTLAATSTYVGGNVNANGESNRVIFQGYPNTGTTTPVTGVMVDGNMMVSNGGAVEIHSLDADVGGLTEKGGAIYFYGDASNAGTLDVASGVLIANGITFNTANTTTSGLIVSDVPSFTLSTTVPSDISVGGGIDLMDGATLALNSGKDINLSGVIDTDGTLNINATESVVSQNDITVGGALSVNAAGITLTDIYNSGTIDLVSGADVNIGIVENVLPTSSVDVSFDIAANGAVVADAIGVAVGAMDINADTLSVENSVDISGGNVSLNTSGGTTVKGDVLVSGVLGQGDDKTSMLNIVANNTMFAADNLTVDGFDASGNTVSYNIAEDIIVNGDMTVGTSTSLATAHFVAKTFDNTSTDLNNLYTFNNYGAFSLKNANNAYFDNVVNSGALVINTSNGITMAAVQNDGMMSLNSGGGIIDMARFETNDGRTSLYGVGLMLANDLVADGTLYQRYGGILSGGDIGIYADEYTITASNITLGGITQTTGTMNLASADITVNGDINVVDLTISADELDVFVDGNVSGGTKILGLDSMQITGDYTFDKNSQMLVNLSDTSLVNYWSNVSVNNDSTLGQITNAADGAALIQVGGQFTSGVRFDTLSLGTGALSDGQIGLSLQDVSDISAETAIWLLAAEQGVAEFSNIEKIRNLDVLFCNATGTMCVVLDNDTLGAYITMRDMLQNDGVADSLYVVFDPRFGGPVLIENNRIQPIVGRQPGYSVGEYVAAGALDNLIAGQLLNTGFFNKTPIEVIPAIFSGTNVETLMTELYNRMEYYVETMNGAPLVMFSRLVQPREIEQIAGAIALNEHTSFRDFEDRMFDEFIWNRNRNLKKAWGDFDFGMFSQNVADDKRVYGNRFSIAGGFDWQESDTLIVGLTGRVSHTSSDNSDDMSLGYIPNQSVAGNVSVDVADTNIGLGAYVTKTLGQNFRLYGNAFVDMHLIDTTRHQTFMNTIDGSGTAFALTTEWGLMHDWLNQYIVGNLYARMGYNFGFAVTEKAAGENYMDLESDGYLMLTPGYSLSAQKRIYPSVWFQIRPYVTIGVEYDVLGAPDYARYKFAAANVFSEYDIEIDPFWANIGGGFEFLAANGLQFGIDYRYQYNNDMQLHNIKLSGSYRF